MAIKILNSIKYITTIVFLFVGIAYIYSGNRILEDLTLDENKLYVPTDFKNNTESKKKKLHINKIILPIDFSSDIIITISSDSLSISKEKINITKEIISSEFNIFSLIIKQNFISNRKFCIFLNISLKIYIEAI